MNDPSPAERRMTFEQECELAAELYRCFQSNAEAFDCRNPAAGIGSFDDANHYTQRVFREAASRVIKSWERMRP